MKIANDIIHSLSSKSANLILFYESAKYIKQSNDNRSLFSTIVILRMI